MTIKPVAWQFRRNWWPSGDWSICENENRHPGAEYRALYGPEAMAEIERLQAEVERLQRLFTQSGEQLDECRQQLAEARNKALDEVAAWHDAKVHEYTDQIAVNNAYLARVGRLSAESRANEYCDDQRSTHRRSAAAIRALKDRAP